MEHVRFVARDGWGQPSSEPGTFTLVADNWDDFNYKTLYSLHFATNTAVISIGMVKIARRGMKDGDPHTELPREFTQLDTDLFSLGQGREYYENIMALPGSVGKVALEALRDIAASANTYAIAEHEPAFEVSLLRDIPVKTITTQFRRIVEGGLSLTPYDFSYTQHNEDVARDGRDLQLRFTVVPDSTPPTNTHVVIGSNGVGKTHLLRNIAEAATGHSQQGGAFNNNIDSGFEHETTPFVNVITISFSAFDGGGHLPSSLRDVQIHTVGLHGSEGVNGLRDQFVNSITQVGKLQSKLWLGAIKTLCEADAILGSMPLDKLVDMDVMIPRMAEDIFDSMSSGHKIVVLTITRLVELVQEKSLVLLDEPETHLHPPLLSALMRVISDIVVDRNGVAIIATHSPVVLQEVPRSCVWMLRRSGGDVRVSRPTIESFGESVSRLTAEVFRLDILKTGYHTILSRLMAENNKSKESVLRELDNQVGSEGLYSLYSFEETSKADV